MNKLIIAYSVIIGFALFNWVWCRILLYKGLDHAFIKRRETPNIALFFERHKVSYLIGIAWLVMYLGIVGFAAGRILSISGLWSLETAAIFGGIWLIWARDRLHYVTAAFVVKRMAEQR